VSSDDATVPQAEGMLAQRLGLTIPHATVVLIGEAARTRRTLHDVASAIVYDGFRIGDRSDLWRR